MKRPIVRLAVIFCSGIISANLIKINFIFIYFLSVILLIFSILFFKKNFIFGILLSSLIFSSGYLSLKNSQIIPNCHISKYAYYKDNKPYLVRGVIDSQPLFKNNRASFLFKTKEIQFNNINHACCGDLLVYIKGAKDFVYGEELILKGNLRYPGRFRKYLYKQGVYSVLYVEQKSPCISLNKNKGLALKKFSLRLKARMEEIIFKYVPGLPAFILDAMILGEKRNIPPSLKKAMVRTGTIHILVVSGFIVSIVSFTIILFLKLIRVPKVARFMIAIPSLVVYCLMTGAAVPVIRATVMAIVFITAILLKKEADIYNSCAVALLFILAINPQQLFDAGLQLSFTSVLAIVYLYPKISIILRPELLKIKYLRFLLKGCLVSLSAWLGTMGFIAYYFKIFSPVTVLANMVIVPLATLITWCGFSLVLAGLIFSPIAPFFASTIRLIVMFLIKINAFLAQLPGAYFCLK